MISDVHLICLKYVFMPSKFFYDPESTTWMPQDVTSLLTARKQDFALIMINVHMSSLQANICSEYFDNSIIIF